MQISSGGKKVNKEENEVNVLDELNKGACMGMDAIHFMIDKVENEVLKKELDVQYNQYKSLSNKIRKLYPEYNEEKEPHETNILNKVMTWYGIEMKTLIDESTSKQVELLLQGTNMGIIEGRKLLNHKEVTPDVEELIEEYVEMQEKAVEKLKTFL